MQDEPGCRNPKYPGFVNLDIALMLCCCYMLYRPLPASLCLSPEIYVYGVLKHSDKNLTSDITKSQRFMQ